MLGIGAFVVWWLFAALAWALWGALLALSPRRPVARITWAVATIGAIEACYPRVFPWNLGSGFASTPWLAQGAWWVGVSGLSALAVLTATLAVEASHRPRGERRPWVRAIVGLLLIWTAAGAARHHGDRRPEGTKLRIGYVQAEIALERRHADDAETAIGVLAEVERRTRALLAEESPDVVIWSEGMLPHVIDHPQVRAWVRARIGGPIIIGGLGNANGRPVNRVFLQLDPAGPVEYYDKRFLVPFGEEFPLRGAFDALGVSIPGDLGRGDEVLVSSLRGVPISPSICFEGILAPTARDIRDAGARLHINVTEDLWYGRASEPRQHLALTRMRAVEAGLPLVRVTNGGISAACDHRGRILERVELGGPRAGVFEITVPDVLEVRPLSQEMFRWLPLLAVPLLLVALTERRRRRRDDTAKDGTAGTPD